MRTLALIALLTACGTDAKTYDCEELSRTVSQGHGTCRQPFDQEWEAFGGCIPTVHAYCLPDGLEASCPAGWGLGCSQGPGGSGINCTYGPSTSCTSYGETVEFSYVQTLNGVQGIAVIPDVTQPDRCEFRACNQL
jgi:hypothetical protein